MTIELNFLQPFDKPEWLILAQSYMLFYNSPTSEAEFETAWDRLIHQDKVFGLAAKIDGKLVGFAHYLFHTNTWAPTVCYLQDLFTAPDARGLGVGSALIKLVAEKAKERDAARYYWLTQDNNTVARRLYDKLATHHGFIRYEFSLNADT